MSSSDESPFRRERFEIAPEKAGYQPGRSTVTIHSRAGDDEPALGQSPDQLATPIEKADSAEALNDIPLAAQDARDAQPRPEERPEEHRPGIDRLPVVERGHYGMRRDVGQGGLGRVTAARDLRLDRDVAIKEMLQPRDCESRRFLREALLTARLQHPSIVPVYEAGYWPDRTPFYAMKLVAGRTLADVIREVDSLDERLRYLPNAIAVADAIAYAHDQGIIHRDLKPSNIILGEFGETVVVDWGLGKTLDTPATEDQPIDQLIVQRIPEQRIPGQHESVEPGTEVDAILGTPGYMPPEQARGPDVDERADIYALGALLYHLLAGRPPYRGTVRDILDQIAHDDPVPLSDCAPGTPRELVTIVERAMAREPEKRYQSALELAADLKRFQNGQLVSAYEYSRWSLVVRWLHRHRALVTVVAVSLAVLAIVAAIGVWRVLEERDVAKARSDQLTVAQAALEPDPTAAIAWLKTLPSDASNWDAARFVAVEAYNRGVARHVWRDHESGLLRIALSPDGAHLASAGEDGTVRVRDLETNTIQILSGHSGYVWDVAFSPDGSLLASAGWDGSVKVWNRAGTAIRVFPGSARYYGIVRFSPDGRFLAYTASSGAVQWRDLNTGDHQLLAGDGTQVSSMAFSPDGKWLATGSKGGTLALWSVPARKRSGAERAGRDRRKRSVPARKRSGAERAGRDRRKRSVPARPLRSAVRVAALKAHASDIRQLAFSPDSARLATASKDEFVRSWRIPSGELITEFPHRDGVYWVRFSPSGLQLVSTTRSGSVQLWDLATQSQLFMGDHNGPARGAEFSSDGAVIISWGDDGTVRLWDIESETNLRAFTGHKESIKAIAIHSDGTRLWSAGPMNGIREWDLARYTSRRVHGPRGNINGLALTSDGRYVAAGYGYGGLILWSPTSGRQVTVPGHGGNVNSLVFSSQRYLISGAWDGSLQVYDRVRGVVVFRARHGTSVNALSVSPDGREFATASRDGTVAIWNLENGHRRALLDGTHSVYDVAYSPDGRRLATASHDGAVKLWHVANDEVRTLGHHDARAARVLFTPDGNTLVSAGFDNMVRQWDLASGESRALAGHAHPVEKLELSPDGDRLASLAAGSIIVWDLATGDRDKLDVPRPHDLAWGPDQSYIVLTCHDRTIRMWDLTSGRSHVLTELEFEVDEIEVSLDGSIIVFGDRNQTVHAWRNDIPVRFDELRAWLNEQTTAAIAVDRTLASPIDARLTKSAR